MKKYTYEDWLAGKDEIPADSDLFNSDDWEEVIKKQKSIYESLVDQSFIVFKEEFQKALEGSIDQEHFIRSGFESLEMIFNTKYRQPTQDIQLGKGTAYYRNIQFVPGIGQFNYTDVRNAYYNLLEGNRSYSIITYPEVEKIKDTNKSISIELWTIALYKLYRFVEREYEEMLNSKAAFQLEKIKWRGKPAEFAYLFKELAERNWIDKPRNSDRGLAEWFYEHFDVNSTSFNSFYIEFTKNATLTDGGKSQFQLKTNPNKKPQ